MTPRDEPRYLLVTADDFGIGPDTSRGILELAARGAVTSAVLLVSSPFAAEAVGMWRRAGGRLELGWHPCLTLDRPVSPPNRVSSLVDDAGWFLPLGRFLRRLFRGRIDPADVRAELEAQYERFLALVGHPPANVNVHHHLHVFRPVGDVLREILASATPRPYLRRVVEPRRTLARVRGARAKRLALSWFGRRAARLQAADGFPGPDALVGITDPLFVWNPEFFRLLLANAPGRFVELTCHPGLLDPTLVGRDGTLADGQVHRRQRELELLRDPGFLEAVAAGGFTLVTAARMAALKGGDTAMQGRLAG
jgi:predicted glycoside hydrolase/deacetylase ChbG (UPF0249 family)